MSIPGKVLIAVLVAFAVAGIAAALDPGYTLTRALPIAAAAAVLSVVLSHRALRMPAALSAGASGQNQPGESGAKAATTRAGRHADRRGGRHAGRSEGKAAKKAAAASKRSAPTPARAEQRAQTQNTEREGIEQGRIKWFDGAKGFGFIIRANGEEIFVHHRSVLGKGRHSLKDGAAVRYRVVNTDKGPQAEDVEPA